MRVEDLITRFEQEDARSGWVSLVYHDTISPIAITLCAKERPEDPALIHEVGPYKPKAAVAAVLDAFDRYLEKRHVQRYPGYQVGDPLDGRLQGRWQWRIELRMDCRHMLPLTR